MSGVLSFLATPADIRQVSPVNPLPVTSIVSATNPGYSNFRSTALTFDPQSVKDAPGNLFAVNAINQNSVPVYLKFYDTLAATIGAAVNAGLYEPALVVLVPASDGTTPGAVRLSGDWPRRYFATAIAVNANLDIEDVNVVDPTIPLLVEAVYK